MDGAIDFTNCRRILGRAYNGKSGKKIAVEYDGKQYMLKFPPLGEEKPAESYSNSCVSEHIASSIFNLLGVNAQKTMLGTFAVGGKSKVVCACLDFTADEKQLFDFCSVKNTVLDSNSNGNGTELEDVLETIDKQQFVDPIQLREHFWNMFVVDALLGNFDRHNGNWGLLYDPMEQRGSIAPVFGCGSCLMPKFPVSALKHGGKKIEYHDFLIKADYEDCNQAVRRIYERTDMKQLKAFIDTVPYLTDQQQQFYKNYIAARLDLILRPAYEIIVQGAPEQADPTLMM